MRFGIAVGMVVLALSGPANAMGGMMVVGIAMMVAGGGMIGHPATEGAPAAPGYQQPGASRAEGHDRATPGDRPGGASAPLAPVKRADERPVEAQDCNH